MFNRLEIRNFRGAREITLSNLVAINLLTGKNAAGKTSVLESIFLLAGANNAGLALSISSFRNDGVFSPEVDRPFRSLFYELDPRNVPVITAYGSFEPKERASSEAKHSNTRRSLEIRPLVRTDIRGSQSSTRQVISGVTFRFRGPSGRTQGQVRWNETTYTQPGQFPDAARVPTSPFVIDSTPTRDLVDARFVTPYFRDLVVQLNAQLTNALKTKSIERVLNICRIVEPRLQALVPLTESNSASVYADLGLPQLVPISILGAGFYNILNLALTVGEVESGLILIDEIEDGLHYSVRPALVHLLFEIAKSGNVQFFITSHSDEMIRAFGSAVTEDNQLAVTAHRLVREADQITVSNYSPSEFEAAIELDAELR
jgi:predicted ATPase